MLLLFMVGAAAPVAVMAVLSFMAISRQLRQQEEDLLGQFTNLATQSILERLALLATMLERTGSLAHDAFGAGSGSLPAFDAASLPPAVQGIAIEVGANVLSVGETVEIPPDLSPEDEARLVRGEAVMFVGQAPEAGRPRLLMAVPFDATGPRTGRVWARIVGDSIWAPAVTQASDIALGDMCILDSSADPLFCVSGTGSRLPDHITPPDRREANSGQLEVQLDEGAHLVAWRDVYLRAAFNTPSWTLVVSQPTSSVYAAGDAFVYNLLLTILIGLSAALLVTHVLVRRTMDPLRELTAGTRRIGQQDLDARVAVRSRDEFGDLASAFNDMAEQLGLQFRLLEARRAIDHAALIAADQGDAAYALLEGVGSVVPSGRRALLLSEHGAAGAASLYTLDGVGSSLTHSTRAVEQADPSAFLGKGASFIVEKEEDVAEVFRPLLLDERGLPMLILPLSVGGKPFGAIALASDAGRPFTDADRIRAQGLADQAAVALEKLRLDRELSSMSWEALRALANAIDAKSGWTTGHSERVTALSLALGRELGLGEEDMDTLHRGGLLHDIGKIATPAEVLDFSGKLDPDMRAIMEKHPEEGARILEPIRAFRPILPIVLYHHERWNGSGYPRGLKGLEIPPLARLVAVADVFDAMASARPYRAALDPEVVLGHIRNLAGVEFDADIVRSLERVMQAGWGSSESVLAGVQPRRTAGVA